MKRKLPPLNALKSFEAAARHGSFRDAADELHVSHSAISHQIKHLEEYLGVDLFARKPRSVELTQTGKNYYPVLRDAFDRIAESTKILLRPQMENVLTVQMYSTFAIRWLMLRLHRFNRKYPEIQVRLNTNQWDANFEQDDIDLALKIGVKEQNDINYDYLFSPTLFPVCSPKLLEKGPPINTPEDLVNHTILQVYPSEKDWFSWLDAHQIKSVDPDSGLRFDSYDHAIKTAVRGLGVALAMQPYVAEDFEAGHLVDPLPDYHVKSIGHWYLVYPKERIRLKKIRLFREWLLEEVSMDENIQHLIDPGLKAL